VQQALQGSDYGAILVVNSREIMLKAIPICRQQLIRMGAVDPVVVPLPRCHTVIALATSSADINRNIPSVPTITDLGRVTPINTTVSRAEMCTLIVKGSLADPSDVMEACRACNPPELTDHVLFVWKSKFSTFLALSSADACIALLSRGDLMLHGIPYGLDVDPNSILALRTVKTVFTNTSVSPSAATFRAIIEESDNEFVQSGAIIVAHVPTLFPTGEEARYGVLIFDSPDSAARFTERYASGIRLGKFNARVQLLSDRGANLGENVQF